MPYKQTSTWCVVRLVALRGLSAATLAQCHALRAEAGRLWTDLVALHARAHAQGQWLSAGDLEQATKGGQYALHSQSVQALCQKLAANVATAVELRAQEFTETGTIQAEYPYHAKRYQTVVWKDQALQILPSGHLRLPIGGQRPPILLPLPREYHVADLRRAELTWRADHYELCFTLDTGTALPAPLSAGETAGVDLGEVHIAAMTTTKRHALVVSGRMLRACKPGRNKRHAALQARLDRCDPDSRSARRLRQRTAQTSAKLYRQQRDMLHKAAKQVVEFCQAEGVRRLAVGDVRDVQTGVHLGKVANQKISQWPHGHFVRYLAEKAAKRGMPLDWIDEAYSTKTCCACGQVQPHSPRGRQYRAVWAVARGGTGT